MKKKTIAGLAAIGAVLGAATAAGIVASKRRQRRLSAGQDTPLLPKHNVYIAGGGIAGLSAAFYLIHDCGFPGEAVHIYEASSSVGGIYSAGGSAESGYIAAASAPIRLKNKSNMADMLSKLPSVNLPDMSVADEIKNFCAANPLGSFSRLVDDDCLEADTTVLSRKTVRAIRSLISAKEEDLLGATIAEYFDEHPDFLCSGLWLAISTSYMLKPGSAALELRDLLRVSDIEELYGAKNAVRTQFNLHETITDALYDYLTARKAEIVTHCRVTDAEIDSETGHVSAIHLDDKGTAKTFYLNSGDMLLVTNGSASECASLGDYNSPAYANNEPSAALELWRRLAEKCDSLGDPERFLPNADSQIISFTITTRSPLLTELIKQRVSGTNDCGAVTTFTASPWGLTIMCPPQPYFSTQDDDTYVICGWGVNTREQGEYIEKTMEQSSGAEILFELVKLMQLDERWDEITETVVNVIPCIMPYAAASALPCGSGDKPLAVPFKNGNLAFIGRFARLGCGVSGSCEHTVRTAREAAYRLSGMKKSSAAPQRKGAAAYLKMLLDLR